MKPPTSVCGPYDPIRVPTVAHDDMIDYEAELAVVVGKKCRNVTKEQALNYVAGKPGSLWPYAIHILLTNFSGYTICNDVSARNWQLGPNGGGQWNYSKGFDTFAPLGPMIVSSKVITDPQTLKLGTRLDGRLLQDFTTADMIFDIPTIVSFLSQGTTLMPGDVIITGTPHGVGYTRTPPVLLKHGTECEIFIERIGNIVNPVEYERGQSKL
jgi:2-keto-4-pentenoate hydratase/2-oxohepta-3-ene-1,7-dioic acid hydratase in catechol pathway